ncbi:hypothetical protein Cantr_04562 [Candida viswanathii]|uniref:CID domain-containing protein n=1 Tax=Candida viswanathii TaxID=5486 RepID=A0A367XM53_9ASCO|nr:hypothetical protein Cantr_04562 [Candida viswanathii]
MDSFDIASKLLQMLHSISPQLQNITKIVHFALKNHKLEDYLLPTIIDVIDDKQLDSSVKSNVFQFIELLLIESYQNKDKFNGAYVHGLMQNLPYIIKQVIVNKSNLHNTYLSLCNISKVFDVDCDEYILRFSCDLLTEEDLVKIANNEEFEQEEKSKEKEEDLVKCWKILLQDKRQSQYERARLLKHGDLTADIVDEDQMFSTRDKTKPETTKFLSKRQILARMEDDREVHKRSKESFWVVNRDKDKNANFITENEFLDHYWNRFQPLDEKENNEFLDSLKDMNDMVRCSYKDKY